MGRLKEGFDRMRLHKKLLGSYGISCVLHASVLAVMMMELPGRLLGLKEAKNPSRKILINLKDLPDLDEEVSPEAPFMSQRNRALRGKLSEEKGVLVTTPSLPKEDKHLPPTSPAQGKRDSSESPESSGIPRDKRHALVEDEANPESQKGMRSKVDNVSPKGQPHERIRELVTKTTHQKFHVNLSDPVQVGSTKDPNAEFYLEFAEIIKKRFLIYIRSSPLQNYRYVKADQVKSSGKVFKSGMIRFDKVTSPSQSQPYFNYLAERIIDQPGMIKTCPKTLFKGGVEVLHFEMTILYTGVPENQWWCHYYFNSHPDESTAVDPKE